MFTMKSLFMQDKVKSSENKIHVYRLSGDSCSIRNIIAVKKLLVNAITLLRLPLTGMGLICLYQYGCSSDSRWTVLFAAISLCIYFSDFIDGRMARRWGVSSDNGKCCEESC